MLATPVTANTLSKLQLEQNTGHRQKQSFSFLLAYREPGPLLCSRAVEYSNSIHCAVACWALLWTYLIDLLLSLDHAQQRVVKPVLELRMTGKDLGHEEVHQGPQLHQIVLQRCTCKASGMSIQFYSILQGCACMTFGGQQGAKALCL